ncbi:MAG: hypothetical protein ACTSR3_22130 [Candidatus Helarchaeota archaeon]
MNIVVEQYFTTFKEEMFLEGNNLMGLHNIQKHVAMKCVLILAITIASLCMDVFEATHGSKYFQCGPLVQKRFISKNLNK